MDLSALVEAFARGEGELLSDTRRGVVRRLSAPGGDVVVKELRPRRGVRGLRERLRRWFGRTRGQTADQAARRLRASGLPVPEPLGAVERGSRTLVISRWVPGEPLDRVPAARLAGLVVPLSRLIGRLHAAGAIHGDLKLKNVLVDAAGRLTLIDLDRVRFGGRFGAGARARDLAPLEAAARAAGVPASERGRALASYQEVAGAEALPRLRAAIGRRAARMLEAGTTLVAWACTLIGPEPEILMRALITLSLLLAVCAPAQAARYTLVAEGGAAAEVVEGAEVYATPTAVRVLTAEGTRTLERARLASVDREHEASSRLRDQARRLRQKAFREFRKDAKRALRRYGKASEAQQGAFEAELRAMPEAALVEPLGDALDDDRAATRELAARLLGESQVRPAAVDELLKAAMTSKRGDVRALAHEAAVGADALRTRVVYEAVAQTRTKPERRVAALGLLGQMQRRESMPAIIGVLEYVQSDIRTAQAKAGELRRIPLDLGSQGPAGTNVPVELPELQLVEVNTTTSVPALRSIQAQAVKALSAISGQDYGTDVAGWKAWWEREGQTPTSR